MFTVDCIDPPFVIVMAGGSSKMKLAEQLLKSEFEKVIVFILVKYEAYLFERTGPFDFKGSMFVGCARTTCTKSVRRIEEY